MMTITSDKSSARLPLTKVPNRGGQVAMGVLALIGTLLIVVGVPILLLAAFGKPWPSGAPSAEWLTRPTTTETLLAVLALVVWIAWAHFVVCLAVEAIAERRHRGIAPSVPGGGLGTQALARRIIAAIVLIAGTTSVGIGSASAATASSLADSSVTSTVIPQAAQLDQTPDEDQVGVSGAALPEVAELDRATGNDVKAGITTYYDVKPPNGRHYDTLWDIAERYLGNGLRYKEIWELNKDVTQPDGRSLTNADLIHPGWVMKMPDDAKGPGLKVVDHAPPGAGEAEAGDSLTQSIAEAAAETPVANGSATATGGVEFFRSEWQPFFGVAGGLALAGAFLGMRRQRAATCASALWRTRPSQQPDPTDPHPSPPNGGGRLSDEADVSGANWLAASLRAAGPNADLAQPSRISYGESGLAIAFDSEPQSQPPAGWRSANQTTWTLDRRVQPAPSSGLSPLPGLVCLGRRPDGSLVLIDLESQSGEVALAGDDGAARGLALSMALDTATHPWADRRRVNLIGFADDLSQVSPGVVRHADDLGRVLESLVNVARHQRQTCGEVGAQSVAEARRLAPQADWTYHLVVCSGTPDNAQLAQLRALAADPLVSLGAVIIGSDRDAGLALHVRSNGQISAPHLGIEVTAQVLDAQATRELATLFDTPMSGDRPSLNELAAVLQDEAATTGAQEAAAPIAQVDILGPIQVRANGQVEPARVPMLTELLVFLALHPQGVHANRVSAALWPRGVDGALRDSALSQLTTWLGSTSDGEPALRQAAGVWSLTPGAIGLDWDSFRAGLNRAGTDGDNREAHLRAALDLVQGPVFDVVADQRYSWLEGLTVRADIALAIELTVQSLAEAAVSRGDIAAADAALRRGIALLPANEEIWRSRLWLAKSYGKNGAVHTVTEQMYAAIAEHGSAIGASPATDALVDELLPGYRSDVA